MIGSENMDELCQARSELNRLEKEERATLERLLRIRMEIKTYRTRIDTLVREGPSPIGRLPPELLSCILKYSITDDSSLPQSMQSLAGVSRMWRDAILNTPSFWNSVRVVGNVEPAHLRTQLRRSCQLPLHVWIHKWGDPSSIFSDQFDLLLEAITPTANRWVTLSITSNAPWAMDNAMDKFRCLKFTSLTKVDIVETSSREDFLYPDFLTPAYTPVLQDLTIEGPFSLTQRPRFNLKLLRLQYGILPVPISSGALTSLLLAGSAEHWHLGRNNIYFPLLETLSLQITHPHMFLAAIVAPKLRCFEYFADWMDYCGLDGFSDLRGKFSHVPRARLNLEGHDGNHEYATLFCQAFPGVRHVDVHVDHTFFFEPTDDMMLPPPMDNWKTLEILDLSFANVRPIEIECHNHVITWLTRRQELCQPPIRVRLIDIKVDKTDMEEFSRMCNVLKGCCTLELVNVRYLRSHWHSLVRFPLH